MYKRQSDDGEPSGTAGGPMLNILQKNNLGNVLVVVTRYFGGILLGAGGLVRAYSDATLNAIEIYEGQLIEWNPLTEEFQFDYNAKQSDRVIGYVGFFELLNGFKKTVYWTKQEIELHKRKFSKSDFGWKKDFDAMAKKTVLRNMLSKWGILSVEMQKATVTDENVVKDINENGDILSDTNVEEDTPERKQAEKVEDVSSAFDEYEETANIDEQQDSLFDDMNPPL